jgi:hypothetical protein
MSAIEPAFNRPALEQLLGKRFFYAPAFSLYGGKKKEKKKGYSYSGFLTHKEESFELCWSSILSLAIH